VRISTRGRLRELPAATVEMLRDFLKLWWRDLSRRITHALH
jgi:hypothetical protein